MRHLVLPATHVCHASCQVWAIFGDSDRVFVGSPTPSFAFLFLNNTFSKVGVGIHEMFGHFSVIRTELFLCGKDPRGTYSHKLFFGLTADGSEPVSGQRWVRGLGWRFKCTELQR